jgi:CheY-like chemotaxis protein
MTQSSVALKRPLEGVRILIVDDNPDAREMLSALLAVFGASTAPAASVREALYELDRSDFDVLLTDVHMPDEDAFALMRGVRAVWAGSDDQLPAVALTADSDPGLGWALAEAGFRRRLLKPVESSELVAALQELVRAA